MKLLYKLSGFFAVLVLVSGIAIIILNSEVLRSNLQENMITREKIGIEILEKRIFPYLADRDFTAVTGIIFEEKEIKKGLIEYIAVYDKDGNIAAHTFLSGIPLEFRHSHGDVGALSISDKNINGVQVLDFAFDLEEGMYKVGHAHIGYRKDYIDNVVSRIVGLVQFVVVGVVWFAIFFGVLFSRHIVEPINRLAAGMKDVGRGNLNVRVSVKTGDELESLAKSFNSMIAELKESKAKVEDYSRNLEKKVAEKTGELEKNVEELTANKSALLNMMDDTEKMNMSLAVAQENLKKNIKELKELDIEKDKFISIAAHELKTPMTAIHGFTQLLEDEKIIRDAQKRNKYLKIIEKEIERLARLVSEVLDLSRIDIGAVKLAIEDTDIPQIANEVAESLAQKAKEKNLTLNVNADRKLPKVRTDKEKLKEILVNLVSNSIKYTEKGSIKIEISKDGENVKFAVSDTGVGIPKESFGKMFTRFYQVETPLIRKSGGTGLGLSICKEFVKALGGKIWFESKLGKGSTFYFTLPVKSPEKPGKTKT